MSNMTAFLSELRTIGIDEEVTVEGREALSKYCQYLLSPPEEKEYSDLYTFLTWFGNEYIGPKVITYIQDWKSRIDLGTIYDMGCGTGWLGHSIKKETGLTVIGIDRRVNDAVKLDKYWIYDVENAAGFVSLEASVADEQYLTNQTTNPKHPIFVGSHFLHCIDNWVDVLKTFHFPWIVIEPTLISTDEPYGKQLKLFGAEPLSEKVIEEAFLSNDYTLAKKEYVEDQTVWVFLPVISHME